jgi:type VI secretion system protein ImpC
VTVGDALEPLGLLPLREWASPVFFRSQSLHRPPDQADKAAAASARLAASMPCVLLLSRLAHYFKCIARDKHFATSSDLEEWMNRWIGRYVTTDPTPSSDMQIKLPLAEAKIQVEPDPSQPDRNCIVAQLKPWLPFAPSQLTSTQLLVVPLPKRM